MPPILGKRVEVHSPEEAVGRYLAYDVVSDAAVFGKVVECRVNRPPQKDAVILEFVVVRHGTKINRHMGRRVIYWEAVQQTDHAFYDSLGCAIENEDQANDLFITLCAGTRTMRKQQLQQAAQQSNKVAINTFIGPDAEIKGMETSLDLARQYVVAADDKTLKAALQEYWGMKDKGLYTEDADDGEEG